MGAHEDSAVFSRLQIVETGRRRQWSEAEKLRIVEESEAGRRQVSATSRRHGISRTLLLSWRRARDEGRLGVEGPVTFAPLVVTPDAAPPTAATKPRQRGGRIEIALPNGRRLIVGPDVDAAAVARLADALGPQSSPSRRARGCGWRGA